MMTKLYELNEAVVPNQEGLFGEFGGKIGHPALSVAMQEIEDGFMLLSRMEGIIPALESSHAVAFAIREAKKLGKDQKILVNLSGRGDKDLDFVLSQIEV